MSSYGTSSYRPFVSPPLLDWWKRWSAAAERGGRQDHLLQRGLQPHGGVDVAHQERHDRVRAHPDDRDTAAGVGGGELAVQIEGRHDLAAVQLPVERVDLRVAAGGCDDDEWDLDLVRLAGQRGEEPSAVAPQRHKGDERGPQAA